MVTAASVRAGQGGCWWRVLVAAVGHTRSDKSGETRPTTARIAPKSFAVRLGHISHRSHLLTTDRHGDIHCCGHTTNSSHDEIGLQRLLGKEKRTNNMSSFCYGLYAGTMLWLGFNSVVAWQAGV
ncbi:uncharacterized protein UTRI_04609 [Ustilago trichophora]|uniref:Uncharacterized protein n=1 Tax=Ustilago trichophora TaxID=86804 RepID=A0A5C3EGZ6_9BASI|nr:uncharacterized protein UTRI_04609 [Ustilago trichophora]